METGGGSFERGQSEVLGVVLLFAIVLAVMGTVVFAGGQAIDDAKSGTSSASATLTMEELQSKAVESGSTGSAERVSFAQTGGGSEEASGSSVDAADGSARIDESDSTRVVKPRDSDSGKITVTVDGTQIASRNLGRIVYEQDDELLNYEGGGVFRRTKGSESAAIVSPPDFEYRYRSGTPTLSVGIIQLDPSSSASIHGDSFTIQQTGNIPNDNKIKNPLDAADSATISVQSPNYQAWGELFTKQTDVTPSWDHANNKVSITLDGPSQPVPDVSGAVDASNPSCCSEIRMKHKAQVVNYHSTNPPASGEGTTYVRGRLDWASGASAGMGGIEGNLVVEENVELESNSNSNQIGVGGKSIVGGDASGSNPTVIECKGCEFGDDLPSGEDALHVGEDLEIYGHNSRDVVIHGDVYVGGDVSHLENVQIDGDLHVQGELSADNIGVTVNNVYANSVTGSGWSSVHDPSTSPGSPESPNFPPNNPVSGEINDRGNNWAGGNNDNSEVDADTIDGIETSSHCSTSNPADSNYCSLDGGNEYYVNSMTIGRGQTIEFDTTTGPIEIYVHSGVNFQGGTIKITGEAPVRVYNNGDMNFNSGNIETDYATNYAPAFWMYMHDDSGITIGSDGFTGVVYAPGSQNGILNINGKNNDIYGAIIAEMNPQVPKHTTFHFDEALLDASADPNTGSGSSGDSVGWLRVNTKTVEVSDN